MANDIGKFGLISGIIIFLILMIRFAVERAAAKEFTSENGNDIIHYFILSVAVLVMAIPEGLPLSVTLSLAYSVKKMLSDNNLVRKL